MKIAYEIVVERERVPRPVRFVGHDGLDPLPIICGREQSKPRVGIVGLDGLDADPIDPRTGD